jgi:hypothetical protein
LFVTTPNNSLKSNIKQFWEEMGKLDDIFSGTKAAYGFVTLHALSGHSLHRIQ